MSNKGIIILGVAAALLGTVAIFLNSSKKASAANLAGKKVIPDFKMASVARIEIDGGKTALAKSGNGWTVESLYGYSASEETVRKALNKIKELTVSEVSHGVSNVVKTTVVFKDVGGKEVAKLEMGKQHMSSAQGGPMQFGGYPDGRFLSLDGTVVLVDDPLDVFDGDPKKWIDTKIYAVSNHADVAAVTYTKGKETVKLTRKDSTWALEGLGPKEELDTSKTYSLGSALTGLNFSNIVDPKKSEDELGFATGTVYTATLKNGITYTAKVGNKIGTDYAFKVSASFNPVVGSNATENADCEQKVKSFNNSFGKWMYTIPPYSAEQMYKARKDLVKAKEEPKNEEAKSAEKKTEAKPALAAKPAEAKKPEPKKVETKPVEKKVESKPAAKPAPAPAAEPTPAPAAKPAAAPAK